MANSVLTTHSLSKILYRKTYVCMCSNVIQKGYNCCTHHYLTFWLQNQSCNSFRKGRERLEVNL